MRYAARFVHCLLAVLGLAAAPLHGQATDAILDLRVPPSGPGYLLSRVYDVSVGPDGSIYVADAVEMQMLVFSPSGAFMRSVGHRGRGPGEFAGVGGIGWLGDTLYVIDNANMRVSLLDARGDLLHDFPLAAMRDPAGRYGLPFRLIPGGRALGLPQIDINFLTSEDRLQAIPLLVGPRNGGAASQGPTVDLRGHGLVVRASDRSVLISNMDLARAFSGAAPWAITNDGGYVITLTGQGSRQQLVRVSVDDGALDTLSAPRFATGRVPKRVVDSMIDAEVERRGAVPPRPLRRALEEAASHRDKASAIRRIIAGLDGSVWLQPAPWANTRAWMVFDAHSGSIEQVNLPPGYRPEVVTHRWTLGVERNDNDEPVITRYRVARDKTRPEQP